METSKKINKIAVLGAGVMGAQIAALAVNAGIETLLYDLASKDGPLNSIVNKALANLSKLKPSPLATLNIVSEIQAKNYDEDLEELKTCDLIIEAIGEKFSWKEALYQRISPFISKDALIVTNTSGLGINSLAKAFPEELRARFCGVHFFNPPRYMHLVELIPTENNPKELLDKLETWLTSYLGKGVIRAKDSPNFIANRIGVFSLLATMHHAETMNIGLDEVDALTGTLLGRPKSATFRTMDVVGLDTLKHVVQTMWDNLKEDPWHVLFKLPTWLEALIEEGHLGQKTGKGLYSKQGSNIEVFDLVKKAYRPFEAKVSEELLNIMQEKDPAKRFEALISSDNKQAKFLAACFRDLWHYASYHLSFIADSTRDLDLAMRWGFGWKEGPFELWQKVGVELIYSYIEKERLASKTLSSEPLPNWLKSSTNFYNEDGAYAPLENEFKPNSKLAVYKRQLYLPSLPYSKVPEWKKIFENSALKLVQVHEDIALLSFKTKANTINQELIEGINQSLELCESSGQGLIIYQDSAENFSSGADLKMLASFIQAGKYSEIDTLLQDFQNLAMRIKYASVPVIAAVRGRALGGGCELAIQSTAIVSSFESYFGLVEVGVGLIPAGGGCKEFALRAASKSESKDLLLALQPYFQQLATGRVSASAKEALDMGFLSPKDSWLMHEGEVLFVAIEKLKAMQAANYQSAPPAKIRVAGLEAYTRIKSLLVNWKEGQFISKHDYVIADKLAFIICGGDLYQGTEVSEAWLLKLEREAFVELVTTSETKARISYFLETGKPLRN